jgi:lysozyme family protein
MTEADIINGTLDREGEAYTNRASDKGGPTKWGVTLPVLAEFRGQSVTVDQLKALTRDEAYEVFEHLFIKKSGYERLLDENVRALMCDWAVNSGVERASRYLQRTLGVTPVDGKCGPRTVEAANVLKPRVLLKRLGLARQVFYVRTALEDVPPDMVKTTDLDNLEGWLNRNWAVSVAPL